MGTKKIMSVLLIAGKCGMYIVGIAALVFAVVVLMNKVCGVA